MKMIRVVPHIIKEGSRDHILWWDDKGCHCTEANCEVNNGGLGTYRPEGNAVKIRNDLCKEAVKLYIGEVLDSGKVRCNQCSWKEIESSKQWCYMFKDFMPGCKQFRQDD